MHSKDYPDILHMIKTAHRTTEEKNNLHFLLGFFDLLPSEIAECEQLIENTLLDAPQVCGCFFKVRHGINSTICKPFL